MKKFIKITFDNISIDGFYLFYAKMYWKNFKISGIICEE